MKSGRVLFGREETPPRWKFCVSYVNGNLGNAVGAMFVEKYFDENSKHDVSLTDSNNWKGSSFLFLSYMQHM